MMIFTKSTDLKCASAEPKMLSEFKLAVQRNCDSNKVLNGVHADKLNSPDGARSNSAIDNTLIAVSTRLSTIERLLVTCYSKFRP